MAIDERRRLELADAVKRTLGEEPGLTLMEMLPPVGWADVATKHDLDALEHRLKGAFHREMNAQTWRLITAATAMFGLFAVVVRL